ncbi:MAG: alpha/beta hydrolase-fold protein [Gammaproteobacteria bacterium]|jgi:hypothetical protein|nr:alpha/beta hydrolase-fold protein [Gammaproteobacteria bacterium]|tara:strand:+ start:130 stop:1134 length:1005 start_codon:yes stop_codon:yes gene_type:complete
MKLKPYLLLLACLGLLLGCQPEAVEELAAESGSEINIGHIEQFDSAILGEERDLWIYIPSSADDPANTDKYYPVLYLLDGSAHFHSVTGIVQKLGASRDGNSITPEMVVVAIPNTDRTRDLTPTHVDEPEDNTSGGGEDFLDFIEFELIPYIEGRYPVNDYRSFIGHSLGGLMVIESLVTRPHVFENYLAIDPSLWWDDQAILRKAEAALVERDFSGKALFVAVANTMREGMSIDTVVDDSSESTDHIRSILQFSATAEREARNGLQFGRDYYPDDTHGSVPLIAEYDAWRFLFDWHYLNGLNEFVSPGFNQNLRGANGCGYRPLREPFRPFRL